MVMDNIWSQKKKRWDRWHLMTTWAWWISTPIIRMDAILILIENLNHVKHVQFFSKTCRGPEVTITFMVLLDNLRLISRYEETSYYGQSFHYIKWWMIWMTNMDGFMLFYERICFISVSSLPLPNNNNLSMRGKCSLEGFPSTIRYDCLAKLDGLESSHPLLPISLGWNTISDVMFSNICHK